MKAKLARINGLVLALVFLVVTNSEAWQRGGAVFYGE